MMNNTISMNGSFDVKNESVNTGDEQTKMKFHSSHSASLTEIDPCLLLCIGVCCLVSLASFIVFIHQKRLVVYPAYCTRRLLIQSVFFLCICPFYPKLPTLVVHVGVDGCSCGRICTT